MTPSTKNILNAASCPFQVRDCHIKNHSPPMGQEGAQPYQHADGQPGHRQTFRALKCRGRLADRTQAAG
jgi:hypothetical protein